MKYINWKNRKKGFILMLIIFISLVLLKNYFINNKREALEDSKLLDYNISKDSKNNKRFAVSAGHPLAVDVGMQVMRDGGNAVDAAISIAYALNVVQPYGSGIGGGGAMLVYPSDGKEPILYDYQAIAPYNGIRGEEKNFGIPGFVRAMEEVHLDFGVMDIEELIDPAIEYADNGFKVDFVLHKILSVCKYRMPVNQLNNFFPGGKLIQYGSILKQPELAATLKKIQSQGSYVFYEGEIAKNIINNVQGLQLFDFANYKVLKKVPVYGDYKGYDIISASSPFGGITLIQIMELAEILNANKIEENSYDLLLLSEIINEAYINRTYYIADPDYVIVDEDALLGSDHLNAIKSKILDKNSNYNIEINDDAFINEDTTHFVVIDSKGMMVSCTNSLSSWFGSGTCIDGVFLNNHLQNFSLNPNSINFSESGKRPRTFIAPTIVAKEGKPIIGIGTPGGSRIPTIILQVLFRIFNNEDIQTAISKPRFYIEGRNFYYENDFSKDLLIDLRENDFSINYDQDTFKYGAINCLYYDVENEKIYGGADYRRGGAWESENFN